MRLSAAETEGEEKENRRLKGRAVAGVHTSTNALPIVPELGGISSALRHLHPMP